MIQIRSLALWLIILLGAPWGAAVFINGNFVLRDKEGKPFQEPKCIECGNTWMSYSLCEQTVPRCPECVDRSVSRVQNNLPN